MLLVRRHAGALSGDRVQAVHVSLCGCCWTTIATHTHPLYTLGNPPSIVHKQCGTAYYCAFDSDDRPRDILGIRSLPTYRRIALCLPSTHPQPLEHLNCCTYATHCHIGRDLTAQRPNSTRVIPTAAGCVACTHAMHADRRRCAGGRGADGCHWREARATPGNQIVRRNAAQAHPHALHS